MRSPALLIGICLALAPAAAWAQPAPVPPPAQKRTGTVPPPPVAQNSGPRVQPQAPAQSNNLFPFKIPGLSSPGTTTAFDGNQRVLIDRVNMYLMSVQTMIGDFVQVAPDGRRSEGKIYLQKPGRIRFEYNPPSPIELVADGNSVVIRDRKLDTQDLYPLSQTPLRFLLADRIDLINDSKIIDVVSDNEAASVILEESSSVGGTARIQLVFSAPKYNLTQWTITDAQGYDTTVTLNGVDMSTPPDNKLFYIDETPILK